MPLPYREVYDRWQRSKSFGDPRDINTFASDQNEVTGTQDFDAAVKPSWWKQASTSADVNVFEPVAKYSGLEAAGRGIGGLFGGRGAEIGEHVARGLPRTIAQTAPLIAAEIASGGTATPLVAGALATGGLFGAQTYAETGDPTAAAISGVTAAALPAVGKIGGEIGLRALGPEIESGLTKTGQKFTLPVRKTVLEGTETGTKALDVTPYGRFKAARLAGSQAAQIGTLEASSALQAKHAGTEFDPLNPEFLAQQIPFTLLDIAHTARAKNVTSDQVKVPPVLPKSKDYIPPKASTPEAAASAANLADMLDQMTVTAKDQTITPEEKNKMFSDLLGTVMNPEKTTAAPTSDKVIIIGHPKAYEGAGSKVYVTDSKGYDVPEHKNVWINDAEDTIQRVNPDGSVTFIVDKKNISKNVKYPSGPQDFPALRNQGESLTPATPVAPGEAVAPETDLLSLRQKYKQLVNNDQLFQAAVAHEPKEPDAAVSYWQRGIDLQTPAHLKPGYVSPFDSGEQKVLEEAGVAPEAIPALRGEVEQGNWQQLPPDIGSGVPALFFTDDPQNAQDYATHPNTGQVGTVRNAILRAKNPLTVDAKGKNWSDVQDLPSAKAAGHDLVIYKNVGDNADPDNPKLTTSYAVLDPTIIDEVAQAKAAVAKIETATQQISDSQQALNLVPQSSEDTVRSLQRDPQNVFSDVEPNGVKVGEPLSLDVFHGTPSRFGETLPETFFTTDKNYAQNFGEVLGSTVELKKPLIVNRKLDDDLYSLFSTEPEGRRGEAIEQIRKQYGADVDGIVSKEATGITVIAFEPQKVVPIKDRIDAAVKAGATPTQAIEAVRLQTHTPVIDKAKQQVNLAQEELRVVANPATEPLAPVPSTAPDLTAAVRGAQPPEGRGGFLKDKMGKVFTFVNQEQAQSVLDAYQKSRPDDQFAYRVALVRGKYKIRGAPKEVSFEGKQGTSFENVVAAPEVEQAEEPVVDVENIKDQILTEAATTPLSATETGATQEAEVFTPKAEDRPDVSFNDALSQLDLASKNPIPFRNAGKFDDLPTAITAIRQFRTIIEDVLRGKPKDFVPTLKQVNDALKNKGILRFDSDTEMKNTLKKARSGLEEFTGKWRSLTLDSKVPHDQAVVDEIGILKGRSPWSDEQLRSVKGEPGYVPTVDLIRWARTQPEFEQRLARYKASGTTTGGEADAVAMEEIAHDLAFGANEKQHGLTNFLDWFIQNNQGSLIGDLAAGLRKFSDFAHVNLTNEEGKGFWWRQGQRKIYSAEGSQPGFEKWFTGSKVVDETGKPQVVYHGTRTRFDSFDPTKLGSTTGSASAHEGFFFTDSKDTATAYGSGVVDSALRGEAVQAKIDKRLEKYGGWVKASSKLAQQAFRKVPTGWTPEQEAEVRQLLGRRRVAEDTQEAAQDPYFAHVELSKRGMLFEGYLNLKDPLIHDQKGQEFRDERYSSLVKRAKAEGRDGVIIKNTYDPMLEFHDPDEPYNIYVAFEPNQIKSVKNVGTFDPNTSNIYHSAQGGVEGPTTPPGERNQINLNHLPSSREDALGNWGSSVLHELSHDTLADIDTRTDPAAIEFKAKMQRILKTLRESKQIPAEVRKAIYKSLDEKWYDKGGEHYKAEYDKALPGRDSWQNVHYSLQNERELIAGIFDSPELVRIMRETTMPKSPMNVLNFFSQAFARLFGYTPQAETAFGQLLSSYDNYLSGTRNSRGYNGMSYIRDSLVASGVNPGQLASRMEGISELYNTGDIASSISSWERERDAGELPATSVAGPINPDLKTQLINGDPKSVGVAGDNLLAAELPQHRELWLRTKEDLRIAKNLFEQVKKGNIYGEFSLFQEGLNNQGAKLNALKQALDKQDKALGRWVSLDALGNNDGIHRLWGQTLKDQPVPDPTDQSGNEDFARQAMGLENPSAEYISSRRREIAETGAKPMSWIDRMFKFSSFTSQEQPGFKPIYDTTHESQADAFRRMTELQMVKNSGEGGGWNKDIANANKRVFQTPGLDRIASDVLRRAQLLDKTKGGFTFEDAEVQEALNRASTAKNRNGRSDREDVVTAVNSEFARAQHYINSVVPEHLTRMNRILTAGAIIGREIGMPYTKAWDLSGQLYTALGKLRDPAQAPIGAEELRGIAQQMQPDTFTKVVAQTAGFINDSERHIGVLQKYQHYVSEQRYGNYHLVMSREGEPLRESYNTEKAARLRGKELQEHGWTLEDIVPKNRTNVANIYGSDPVVSSMLELDQQALNRFESLMADLPMEKREMLRPLVERAADYTGSQAAFTPIPTQASPKRRFVPGRETIDMIDNAEQYYRRSVNWMRHRETRAQTAFQMLDPELLGNRPLREYATQFVDNNLAPDNPVARRLAEATFYWNLAGNLGVDFLHSIQSLTTGMASVIAETGSTTDAYKYVAGASTKVLKRYTTGKWSDPNTERFVNWLTARGGLGLPAWGDIFDPTTMNYFQQYGPQSTYGKTLNAVKAGVRGYKGIFLRHNDMVGALSGFQIGLDRGMSWEDAARFGEEVKDRGFYSAGKAQRSVGLWNMKEKAVPQLFSALRTYTLGWFSQLAHNYKVGFQGAPADYTPAQIRGAKQAFAYMLGAQAVLAGALGLPGVGQGLGLLKQTTGLDLKGWTRKNLAAMFGEDQDDYGGLMTGMALHGLVSQFAPFDPSGRHIPNFPFIGVTPSKGFDIASLVPAPFTTAADIIGGLGAAAKGHDPLRALPVVARGAVHLLQGEGDIRNSKGELLYQLSPSERVVTALGLEPSRVAAAKETASTVNEMNKAATAQKGQLIDEVATLYRRGDTVRAQKRLGEIQQENPTYDMAGFVRAVSGAVEKQTMPFDWKREVNPALDIVGLQNNQPSRELERVQLRHGVSSDLGLYERPSLRGNIRASSIDDLMNADPYTTRSVALQRLLTARQLRSRNIFSTPEESQSPYQGFGYQP